VAGEWGGGKGLRLVLIEPYVVGDGVGSVLLLLFVINLAVSMRFIENCVAHLAATMMF
jgi:hypothetical protein